MAGLHNLFIKRRLRLHNLRNRLMQRMRPLIQHPHDLLSLPVQILRRRSHNQITLRSSLKTLPAHPPVDKALKSFDDRGHGSQKAGGFHLLVEVAAGDVGAHDVGADGVQGDELFGEVGAVGAC